MSHRAGPSETGPAFALVGKERAAEVSALDRGLRVSVHSDDPPYFGGYVNENLQACCTPMGLPAEDIAALARIASLAPLLHG